MYELSTHRQHFVDDFLVAETHGLRKTLHQPVKHAANPILEGEGDEGEYIVLHGSVLHDPAARRSSHRSSLIWRTTGWIRRRGSARGGWICS